MKGEFCLTFKLENDKRVFGNKIEVDTEKVWELYRELDLLKLGAIQSLEKVLKEQSEVVP